jgi:hypothetical protein
VSDGLLSVAHASGSSKRQASSLEFDMAAKLTCPECEQTLNLAKAPEPGKKVRCPRCKAVFAVPEADGELAEAEAPAPKQKAAIQKNVPAKPAAKSPAKPEPPPPPEPKKKSVLEDEEEASAGTYGFQTTEEEEQKRDKEKPKIEYAPDLTVKDPRGKAVATVAKPSSFVIIYAGLITLTGLFTFAAGIWPFFFANTVAGTRRAIEVDMALEKMMKDEINKLAKAAGGPGGGAGGKPEDKSQYKKLREKIAKSDDTEETAALVDSLLDKIKPADEYIREMPVQDLQKERPVAYKIWELMEERAISESIWMIVIGVLIFLFGGVMTYAAVQMQTLDSYSWGLTGPVMGIIFGIGSIIYSFISMFSVLGNEDSGAFDYVRVVIMMLLCFCGLGVSIWGLITILDPAVKEAFFYDPEKAEQEAKEAAEEEDEDEDEDEEDDE